MIVKIVGHQARGPEVDLGTFSQGVCLEVELGAVLRDIATSQVIATPCYEEFVRWHVPPSVGGGGTFDRLFIQGVRDAQPL